MGILDYDDEHEFLDSISREQLKIKDAFQEDDNEKRIFGIKLIMMIMMTIKNLKI